MGIYNRTLDVSEQKKQMDVTINGTVTGKDYIVYRAPGPMLISDARSAGVGLSGTPTSTLKLQRFVTGAGLTTISISGALTVTALSTSGALQYSLPAAGSSLLSLQAGDVVVATSAGTNAALEQLYVQLVVYSLQDIRAWG